MAEDERLGECSYRGCTRKAVVAVNGRPACAVALHIDHVMTPAFEPARQILEGLMSRG